MAYDNNMWTVRVDGVTATSESWANTWCFHRTDPAATIDDVITALHTFYDDLATGFWTAQTSAESATWRQLNTGDVGAGTWASIVGANAGPLLPPECAIRVSLSAPGNHRGGPFLTGFRSGSLDADGSFTGAAGVVTLVTDMQTALLADDWEIAIHGVKDLTTWIADKVRVGEVYDVIRRRRNQLPENYAVAAL